jgi:hypothetical protein
MTDELLIRRALAEMNDLSYKQKVVLPGKKPVTIICFQEETWKQFLDLINDALGGLEGK